VRVNTHGSVSDTDPPVSEAGARLLVKLEAKRAANKQLSFSTKEIGVLLGVGPTRVAQLIGTGELDTFLEGNRRRALADDVFDLVRGRIIAANPPEGAVKVRQPSAMFRLAPRVRTANELAGLAKANLARHEAAVARRAAAEAEAEGAADT
jgi:hypothetical protein